MLYNFTTLTSWGQISIYRKVKFRFTEKSEQVEQKNLNSIYLKLLKSEKYLGCGVSPRRPQYSPKWPSAASDDLCLLCPFKFYIYLFVNYRTLIYLVLSEASFFFFYSPLLTIKYVFWNVSVPSLSFFVYVQTVIWDDLRDGRLAEKGNRFQNTGA